MIVIDIDDVRFPSINHKYYKNFSLRPEYKNFKNLLYIYCVLVKINPPYVVTINCESSIDIDNFIKPIMDALQDKNVIDNDANVLELHVYKTKIKNGMSGRLTVEVETIEKT